MSWDKILATPPRTTNQLLAELVEQAQKTNALLDALLDAQNFHVAQEKHKKGKK